MQLKGRHVVSMDDLTAAEIAGLLKLSGEMAKAIGFGEGRGPQGPLMSLDRILAALFYEPSTRTRLSFEAAMLRLGGRVTGFVGAAASSAAKGESLVDTTRIVGGYADLIVLRHPSEGAARLAAQVSGVPLVNGGDGAHLHPTQTLADLFLLQRKKGGLQGLRVGLLGDLRYGRTVHSLAPALARLGGEMVCISPPMLRMPKQFMRRVAEATGSTPEEVQNPLEVLDSLDALYVTRIQEERFEDAGAYADLAGAYRVDANLLAKAPQNLLIMHPLPRVGEIDPAVDDDPRAAYFEQAAGGVPVRMALMSALLGLSDIPTVAVAERPLKPLEPVPDVGGECRNPCCVTNHEPDVKPEFVLFAGQTVCAYCERPVAGGG